jgi:hypothetical protein
VSRGDYSYANGNHETPTLKLAGAAKTALTSWPTARASDGAKGGKRRVATGQDLPTTRDWKSSASNQHGVNARPLNEVARLANRPRT